MSGVLTPDNLLQKVYERTPARLLIGRAGSSYKTTSQLELREAHAAAADAVRTEFDLFDNFGKEFCRRWHLFEVSTEATTKEEFLRCPDLGRRLSIDAKAAIKEHCATQADFQIVIGDGLSVSAVATQVPLLLPLLWERARLQHWTFGQPAVVRHCRVGILNDIGELLQPQIVVLLIGERPGLATADSLSAYMALRPRSGHTDANRNLVSNIHSRGTPPVVAAERIVAIAHRMLRQQISGTELYLGA